MTMPATIKALYPKVTSAIMRAENAEARGDASAKAAYSEVSRIEEEIASHLPASSAQGAVARRGAVRAAIFAGDLDRAAELAARFAEDGAASAGLADELREILRDAGVEADQIAASSPAPRTKLAERLFPMAVGDDALLHLLPALPPQAASDQRARELFGEICRVLAEFTASVALREDAASVRYARMGEDALAAAGPGLDACSPLRLDRALRNLDQAYRSERHEPTLNKDEALLLGDVSRLYADLPLIYPALAEFRKKAGYDSFVTPSAEVKQIIVITLAQAAKARKVVSPDLAMRFSMVEVAIVAAPIVSDVAPERNSVWATAEAYLEADLQIQSAESASEAEADRGADWAAFHSRLVAPPLLASWREETLKPAE